MYTSIKLLRLAAMFGAIALTACNGHHHDGNGETPPPTVDTHAVHGVAAIGAAITGANVALSCADGSTSVAGTGSDGSWTTDVPDAALPCAVKLSSGTIGDASNPNIFYSLATASGNDAVTNITPLTDLALARALLAATGNGDLDAWFADPTATLADVVSGLVAARDALAVALNAAGYTVPDEFSPFDATFTPAAGDAYDDLLEALAAAIAANPDVDGYAGLRDSFASGNSVPTAPDDTTPPTPPIGIPLPDGKLGVSFVDASSAYLWLQPAGQGGVTVIDGAGDGQIAVNIGDRTDGGPDGTVQISTLPNKLGTFACGDVVGSGNLQMQLTFNGITNPRKTYVSYQDSYDPALRTVLPGYSCSVTLTHVGAFTSQYIYNDDYIEGTFSAKLRQKSPECVGEGNCAPYKDLVISEGKFRINKTGVDPEPVTPPTETGAGILGTALKNVFAGGYTLKCSASPGQPVQTFAFSVQPDGSSTFQDAPLIDTAHAGTITTEGTLSSSITLSFKPSATNSAYVVLGFRSDGSFYPNSVYVPSESGGNTLSCYSNTGNLAPAASAQATSAVPAAVGALARSETLSCSNGGGTSATAFSINSDGSAQIGDQSYAASTINKISDGLLFGLQPKAEITYGEFTGGQFRSLAVTFDSQLHTSSAIFAVGLGPNDVTTCTVP